MWGEKEMSEKSLTKSIKLEKQDLILKIKALKNYKKKCVSIAWLEKWCKDYIKENPMHDLMRAELNNLLSAAKREAKNDN